jgi:hypothetical protein
LKKSVLSDLSIRLNHNGVLSTEDTITWGYIDIIYITPRQGGRWVLYDHRLAPLISEGYLDPADTMPIPGLQRISPSLWDPYGLDRPETEVYSLALVSPHVRYCQVRVLHPCLFYRVPILHYSVGVHADTGEWRHTPHACCRGGGGDGGPPGGTA